MAAKSAPLLDGESLTSPQSPTTISLLFLPCPRSWLPQAEQQLIKIRKPWMRFQTDVI